MVSPVSASPRLHLAILALLAFELPCVHSFTDWLPESLLRLRDIAGLPIAKTEKEGRPESSLLQKLKTVDAEQDPETARSLHAGIARILRASGSAPEAAIKHLQAAREAAVRTNDANKILDARLELSDLYLETGRPKAVMRELEGALFLLSAENMMEYEVKLDRAKARASFEDGSIKLALEFFQEALRTAVEPEDKVRSACDIAMAHACLGHAERALQPLRNALEVLDIARKSDVMPVDMHRALTMEVNVRFGEAFHSMGDVVSAKTHYDKASLLQSKSQHMVSNILGSQLMSSMRNLESGAGPELRCPGGGRSQSFRLGAQQDGVHRDAHMASKAKVAAFLAAHQHKKAELELWKFLETQKQPYKSLEASATLVSLGDLYGKTTERRNYYKAGQCFMQALRASMSCCGAHSTEAKSAFEGLKSLQSLLPDKVQAKALVVMQDYLSAVDKLVTFASDVGQKEQIIIDV